MHLMDIGYVYYENTFIYNYLAAFKKFIFIVLSCSLKSCPFSINVSGISMLIGAETNLNPLSLPQTFSARSWNSYIAK